jgi:hypothetical protein
MPVPNRGVKRDEYASILWAKHILWKQFLRKDHQSGELFETVATSAEILILRSHAKAQRAQRYFFGELCVFA